MLLTYKFKVRHNKRLEELCVVSNNLYNQANYIIIKELSESKKWLRYNQLDKLMKVMVNLDDEINYKLLKSHTSQHILKLLDKNWTSYFRSLKEFKNNPNKFRGKPHAPKFRKKNGLNILIYTNQIAKIKGNQLILGKGFSLYIPEYKNIDFTKFQQIRILPKNKYFEVEIIYHRECINSDVDVNNYASIDLGVNNFATVISENQTFILSGKVLKSVNQFYNKRLAFLKSIKDKKKFSNLNTLKMTQATFYRNDFVKDYLHKFSRGIINYCLKNKIGTLVAGYNAGWKDSISLGKKTNQSFCQLPYERFLSFLEYKCKLAGINFNKIEESYTSKCDGLALEPLKKQERYLGRRKKRGLFQSSVGKLINADVNGALNILRKVIGDSSFIKKIIDRGFLFNPVKIRVIEDIRLLNFCKERLLLNTC